MLGVVYFYGLTSTGMIGPDEPRYAAIGNAMAHTGDWVTPKLWGSAWFEKPPLLYWMTGSMVKAGLGPEASARLPVALLGFGFVLFFYFLIRHEFGPAEALYATAVLGTSAFWFTYSFVAVTDIPMAVFFSAALLLCLEWVAGGSGSATRALIVGVLLGFAVLAKGLVPLVLFAPVVWPMRRRIGYLALIGAACGFVAGPWYIECTYQNGTAFLIEFFWRHHFERFSTSSLQHVRPFWFYVPVLLGAVFPWTPLIVLVTPGLFRDPRLRFAGLWLLFALAFFSAAKNKLPGYIIPILPVACLILGLGLGWARRTKLPLYVSALLLALTPIAAAVIPDALNVGLSHAAWRSFDVHWTVAFLIAATLPLWLEIRTWRTEALAITALLTCGAFLYVKAVALPLTDNVRPFYHQHANWLDSVCLHDVDRDHQYQLQYYVGRVFPLCEGEEATPKIMGAGPRLLLLN